MRAITEESVMNWTPDLSDRGGWGDRSGQSGMYSKTEAGKMSDLRDMVNEVYIVRIRNFYGDVIASYRVAGSDQDVRNVADEMLNTFCRRFPGSPLSHQMHRFIPEEL